MEAIQPINLLSLLDHTARSWIDDMAKNLSAVNTNHKKDRETHFNEQGKHDDFYPFTRFLHLGKGTLDSLSISCVSRSHRIYKRWSQRAALSRLGQPAWTSSSSCESQPPQTVLLSRSKQQMTQQIQFPVVFLGHRVSPPTTQRQLGTKKKKQCRKREKNNFPPGGAPRAVCDCVAVCVSCCFLNYECTWGSESALIIIRQPQTIATRISLRELACIFKQSRC